jgi:hypothetical protein
LWSGNTVYGEQPVGEVLSSHAGDRDLFDPAAPPAPPRSTRRSGTVIGASALVVALVAGAGVYVASQTAADGDPASVLPATTFMMVKLDLTPSRAQTAAIERFAKRFPAGRMSAVADVRAKTMEAFAESLEVDYAKDIKPWLGSTASAAGFLDGSGEPHWVVALHPKDMSAAKRALTAAAAKPAFAELDGFLVLSDEQSALDDALAAAKERALSDVPEFVADLKRLKGDNVAVAWGDNRRMVTATLHNMNSSMEGVEAEHLPEADKAMKGYRTRLEKRAHGRVTLGLRAEEDFVELLGISSGDSPKVPVGKPAALRRLPGNTIGGVYVRDLNTYDETGTGGFALITDQLGGFGFGLPMSLLAGGRYGTDESFTEGEIHEPMPAETAPPGLDFPSPSPECEEALAKLDHEMGYGEEPPAACVDGLVSSGQPAPSPECIKAMDAWAADFGDGNEPPPLLEPCSRDKPLPAPTISASASPASAGRGLSRVLLQESPEPSDAPDPDHDHDYDRYEGEDPMEAFTWSVLPLLNKELGPHLDGDTTISLGSLPAPGTKRAPDMALLADVRDDAAADKAAKRVAAELAQIFTETPFAAAAGGKLTVASDAAYKDTLGAGNLGETGLFKLAMGDLGDEVQIAAMVNLERVRDAVPGYPAELKPVSAVGLSSGVQDGHGYLRVRVVAR